MSCNKRKIVSNPKFVFYQMIYDIMNTYNAENLNRGKLTLSYWFE